MSQPSNSSTILEKFWNIITHSKFTAIGILVGVITGVVGTSVAIIELPQIQNLLTSKEIDKPLLCPEPESTYSIKIKYPESWALDCTEDAFSGEVAKLIARKNSSVKLLILVDESKQLISLDEHKQSLVKSIEKNSSDVKVVNNQTILGNRPAYELRYTIKKGQIKFIRKEVVMLDARRAYHVIYEAPTYQYDSFKNDAEEMIQSFEIVENK